MEPVEDIFEELHARLKELKRRYECGEISNDSTEYLDLATVQELELMLTGVRVSAHPLKIEAGPSRH